MGDMKAEGERKEEASEGQNNKKKKKKVKEESVSEEKVNNPTESPSKKATAPKSPPKKVTAPKSPTKKVGQKSNTTESPSKKVTTPKSAEKMAGQKLNFDNPTVAESPSKKATAPKSPTKKAGQKSGYSLFVEEMRPNVTKKYLSLNATDTDRMVEEMWNGYSAKQKNEYKKKASEKDKLPLALPEEPKESPQVEGKKKKPGKKSSFIMFCQETRPMIKTENPDFGFGDITKLQGNMWKKMSE